MKSYRITALGLILTGAVATAVTSVTAQGQRDEEARLEERARAIEARALAQAERAREQADRARQQARQRGQRLVVSDLHGARIGVTVEDLDAEALRAAGNAPGGVRIASVTTDGPAAKAGVREGDMVVTLDGEGIRSSRQFARLIQETAPGRSVTLGIVRGGERQAIAVTPETRGQFAFDFDMDQVHRDVERSLREVEPRLREIEPRLREFRFDGPGRFEFEPFVSRPRARLGVQVQELTPQLAEYFGAVEGGVLVSMVHADTPGAAAGLRAGDVITAIGGEPVRRARDLLDGLSGESGEVTITIVRDKKTATLEATLEDRPERPASRRPT